MVSKEQSGGFGQDEVVLSKCSSWKLSLCVLLECWIPSRFLKQAKIRVSVANPEFWKLGIM